MARKTILPLLIALVGISGIARAQVAPAIDPADPHRFMWNDSGWYPAGYYPGLGALTVRNPGESVGSYYPELIAKLSANGVNYFRTVFTMGAPFNSAGAVQTFPYPRTGPGSANDNLPKFNLNQWDQSHFTYWRQVLAAAQAKGIVVQLVLFDSWHNNKLSQENDTWGQKFDFYNGANNVNGLNFVVLGESAAANENRWHTTNSADPIFLQHKKLLEKAVDELGSFPNLIWEVCNEAGRSGEPGVFRSWEDTLANLITAREKLRGHPRHLVMPRDLPVHQFAGGQKGTDPAVSHQELIANFSLNQPLIADNDAPNSSLTPAGRRRKAWAALTAGAHIDYFHLEMGDFVTLRSADVASGMKAIGRLPAFLNTLHVLLRGMQPNDGLVTAGDWCLARLSPWREYVIYLPAGRSAVSVTVAQLPRLYGATWFDPRTGATAAALGGPSFQPPTLNLQDDWVLHVRDAAE